MSKRAARRARIPTQRASHLLLLSTAILLVGAGPSAAQSPVSAWWQGGSGQLNDDWSAPSVWTRLDYGAGSFTASTVDWNTPGFSPDDVVITGYSDDIGELPASPQNASTVDLDGLSLAHVYVGGWPAGYDTVAGPGAGGPPDPTSRGELRILDYQEGDASLISFAVDEISVGVRGGQGRVRQRSAVSVAQQLTLGTGGTARSIGEWYMTHEYEGEVPGDLMVAGGIRIGHEGTGLFYQTGGAVVCSDGTNACPLEIGIGSLGAASASGARAPGTGTYHLAGGSLSVERVVLGEGIGSSGSLYLSSEPELTTGSIEAGLRGNGAVAIAGGHVVVQGDVALGTQLGGAGSLSFAGGTSELGTPSGGNSVVVGSAGFGALSVIGAAPSVTINGDYVQGSNSRLIVRVEDSIARLSAIHVTGNATFAPGAQLTAYVSEGITNGDDVIPPNETVTVMTIDGVVSGAPVLSPESDTKWDVAVVPLGGGYEIRLVWAGESPVPSYTYNRGAPRSAPDPDDDRSGAPLLALAALPLLLVRRARGKAIAAGVSITLLLGASDASALAYSAWWFGGNDDERTDLSGSTTQLQWRHLDYLGEFTSTPPIGTPPLFNQDANDPDNPNPVNPRSEDVYIAAPPFIFLWTTKPRGSLFHFNTAWLDSGLHLYNFLYIGGWPRSFDPVPTNILDGPLGRTRPEDTWGRLHVTGGEIFMPQESPNDFPYIRLGPRGGFGQIEQWGGTIHNGTVISVGIYSDYFPDPWGSSSSPAGLGTWSLYPGSPGGTVKTIGFDLGVGGVGLVNLSGGRIVGVRDIDPGGPNSEIVECLTNYALGCPTRVGRGWESTNANDSDYLPAVATFHMAGGQIDSNQVYSGVSAGSSGSVVITGSDANYCNPTSESAPADPECDAAFVATERMESVRFEVGAQGLGSAVLTENGVLIAHDQVIVGSVSGSHSLGIIGAAEGSLTIGDAKLVAGDPGNAPTDVAFIVGRGAYAGATLRDQGFGHLTLMGGGSSIDVHGRYIQYASSLLTAVVGPSFRSSGDHIRVHGNVDVRTGAKVEVVLEDGYTPAEHQIFMILQSISTTQAPAAPDHTDLSAFLDDIELVGADAADFGLYAFAVANSTALGLVYDPNGTYQVPPGCQGALVGVLGGSSRWIGPSLPVVLLAVCMVAFARRRGREAVVRIGA